MPELRTCRVSYCDVEGVTHSVEVSASSLYEAAALALKAFEQTGWADHPVGVMEVVVKSPAVKHQIPVVRGLRGQYPYYCPYPNDWVILVTPVVRLN